MKRTEQYKIMPKIIDKAIEKGWQRGSDFKKLYHLYHSNFGINYLTDNFYRVILFHLDFAKAFWGEENKEMLIDSENGYKILKIMPVYKYHLQLAILEKDPLDYYAKYLDKLK